MELVSAKTAANTSNTIPKVPLMVPVKYNTNITNATMERMMRSRFPMFFFIMNTLDECIVSILKLTHAFLFRPQSYAHCWMRLTDGELKRDIPCFSTHNIIAL